MLDYMKYQEITPTWATGTAGTALVSKRGGVVTVAIINPTKLAVGNNTIFTLPVGWRPALNAVQILVTPTASISSGSTALSIRLTVSSSGVVQLYNYRSSAISGNTNASGFVSYVVGG